MRGREGMDNLKILYEDNHIIVVVKPVRIPVQEDKSHDLDLLSIIKEYLKEKYDKKGNVYLGLVHRLDRMVGGVMVFAKTSKAASRLSDYIRRKEVQKKYYAIVNGSIEVDGKFHTLRDYLVKNERINMSRVCDSSTKNAKEAILEYQALENFSYQGKAYTLVNILLHTGRHHQIRVQMANMGHPLYGDIKYGQKINKVGQNLALFSYYLSFYHPTKDEYLEFQEVPKEELGLDPIWSVIKYGF